MLKMYQNAIEQMGVSELPHGRWMLEDGTVLGLGLGDDHRYVSSLCPDGNWLYFIAKGACSVHVSPEYVHIRTTGLSSCQRMEFLKLYDSGDFEPYEARVELFNGIEREEVIELDDPTAIRLILTDTIAYHVYLSERR